MKAVNKKQLLDTLEQRVEAHIATAVSDFQNISHEILSRPASNGGWSIAQCLDHLNSYGHYYLPWIQKTLNEASPAGTDEPFRSSWLGNYFTRMMDPVTGTKSFKAFKGHIPDLYVNPGEVIAEFISQQEKLLMYLRQGAEKDLNKRLPISITRLIRLKLGDVFQFLIAHNERHMQQAARNLNRGETAGTALAQK